MTTHVMGEVRWWQPVARELFPLDTVAQELGEGLTADLPHAGAGSPRRLWAGEQQHAHLPYRPVGLVPGRNGDRVAVVELLLLKALHGGLDQRDEPLFKGIVRSSLLTASSGLLSGAPTDEELTWETPGWRCSSKRCRAQGRGPLQWHLENVEATITGWSRRHLQH